LPLRTVSHLLSYGVYGVDLFFVLSGFLITGILLDSRSDPGYFKKFYARRILRIFPLYYGVLVVLALLTPLFHFDWHGMALLLFLYLQNLRPSIIMSLSLSPHVAINHLWSLAVEEQFYLVWPAIVYLAASHKAVLRITVSLSLFALLLRLVLLTHGGNYYSVHANTLCRADSLLMGGFFATAWRSPLWGRLRSIAPVGLALSLLLILISDSGVWANAFFSQDLWRVGILYSILAIASSCLICCSLTEGSLLSAIFSGRWLRFFGKYSYGIYVLHMILLSAVHLPLQRSMIGLLRNKLAAVLLTASVEIAIFVAVAVLSYHLFEKHFLRLKRYFDYEPRLLGRE